MIYRITAEIDFDMEYTTLAGAEHAGRKEISDQIKKAFPNRSVRVGKARLITNPKKIIEEKIEKIKAEKKPTKTKTEKAPKVETPEPKKAAAKVSTAPKKPKKAMSAKSNAVKKKAA